MKTLNINNNLNFNGLVGKQKSGVLPVNGNYLYYEKKKYYPFKNETKEFVDLYIKNNTYTYTTPTSKPYNIDYITQVKLADYLPFTQQEFESYKNNYKAGKKPTEMEALIDKFLADHKLYEYMNEKKAAVPKNKFLTKIVSTMVKFFK